MSTIVILAVFFLIGLGGVMAIGSMLAPKKEFYQEPRSNSFNGTR